MNPRSTTVDTRAALLEAARERELVFPRANHRSIPGVKTKFTIKVGDILEGIEDDGKTLTLKVRHQGGHFTKVRLNNEDRTNFLFMVHQMLQASGEMIFETICPDVEVDHREHESRRRTAQ